MTDREKAIVTELNHDLYTVEFLEHWLNRNDSVSLDAAAALQIMGANGFYEAVKLMAEGSSHESVKWILCSEHLPERNEPVLTWCERKTISGGHAYGIGSYDNGTWFLQYEVGTETFPNMCWEVIAWKPLEPYKEDTAL